MIKIDKINTDVLEYLSKFLVQNTIKDIINDFGTISIDNEHGTVFLNPKNPLFKVISLTEKDGKLISFGLGGHDLGLTLEELYLDYRNFTEGFSIYDDKYVYVFYKSEKYTHTIKIYSENKLIDKNGIINNIHINNLEISIY